MHIFISLYEVNNKMLLLITIDIPYISHFQIYNKQFQLKLSWKFFFKFHMCH